MSTPKFDLSLVNENQTTSYRKIARDYWNICKEYLFGDQVKIDYSNTEIFEFGPFLYHYNLVEETVAIPKLKGLTQCHRYIIEHIDMYENYFEQLLWGNNILLTFLYVASLASLLPAAPLKLKPDERIQRFILCVNGTGYFTYEEYLDAFFKGKHIVGVPTGISYIHELKGSPIKFFLHDVWHYDDMVDAGIFDMNAMLYHHSIYEKILKEEEVKRSLFIFVLWLMIHEYNVLLFTTDLTSGPRYEFDNNLMSLVDKFKQTAGADVNTILQYHEYLSDKAIKDIWEKKYQYKYFMYSHRNFMNNTSLYNGEIGEITCIAVPFFYFVDYVLENYI